MQRFVQSGYHVEFDPDTIMAIEPETFFVISKSKGHLGPIRALVAPIRIYLPPNKPIWAIYVSLMYIFDSPISPFWPLLSSFFLNKVLICHFGTLLAHPLQYGTLFYPFGPLWPHIYISPLVPYGFFVALYGNIGFICIPASLLAIF